MSMKEFEPLQLNYEFEALNHYATETNFQKRIYLINNNKTTYNFYTLGMLSQLQQ